MAVEKVYVSFTDKIAIRHLNFGDTITPTILLNITLNSEFTAKVIAGRKQKVIKSNTNSKIA